MLFTVPVVITAPSAGPSWTDILTAVGTVVLAVFAIVAAIVAGRAYRAQNRQLQGELAERRREAEDRRREQAVQVYVWQTPPSTTYSTDAPPEKSAVATLVNNSPLPIFAVKIGFMRMDSQVFWRGPIIREAPLMPGKEEQEVADWPSDLDLDDLVAVGFFRDRAGISWVTYADGRLDLENPPPGPPPSWDRRLKAWAGHRFSAAAERGRSALATWPVPRQTAVRTWPARRPTSGRS